MTPLNAHLQKTLAAYENPSYIRKDKFWPQEPKENTNSPEAKIRNAFEGLDEDQRQISLIVRLLHEAPPNSQATKTERDSFDSTALGFCITETTEELYLKSFTKSVEQLKLEDGVDPGLLQKIQNAFARKMLVAMEAQDKAMRLVSSKRLTYGHAEADMTLSPLFVRKVFSVLEKIAPGIVTDQHRRHFPSTDEDVADFFFTSLYSQLTTNGPNKLSPLTQLKKIKQPNVFDHPQKAWKMMSTRWSEAAENLSHQAKSPSAALVECTACALFCSSQSPDKGAQNQANAVYNALPEKIQAKVDHLLRLDSPMPVS
ncbi:MAG: hypothetical protein AB7E52_02165 [Bdellovibrionales bacterium]